MVAIETNRRVWRRTVIVTSVAAAMSLVLSLLTTAMVFGLDLQATITVGQLFKFGAVISVAMPAVICPITTFRIMMAIRDRDRAHVELRRLADTDQLTGLLNRRGFEAAAEPALAACRLREIPVSVLMIDIDYFKLLNDGFGHDFGDAALVHVGAVLRKAARSDQSIVGRIGGEEFVALLPGATEADGLASAERLRRACADLMVEHEGQSATITISVGITTRRQPASWAQLAGEADDALYQAKQGGRNRVMSHHSRVTLTRVA